MPKLKYWQFKCPLAIGLDRWVIYFSFQSIERYIKDIQNGKFSKHLNISALIDFQFTSGLAEKTLAKSPCNGSIDDEQRFNGKLHLDSTVRTHGRWYGPYRMFDQTINLGAVIHSVFRTHSGLMIQWLDISTFNKYMYY